MDKSNNKNKPYSEMSYATEPTRYIRFMRNFFIKQFFDFFRLNYKIMRIVVGGHT